MAARYVCVLIALATLAASAPAVAQLATEGNFKDIETCRARAGGSRIRSNNCENDGATSTVRAEHEINIKLELPAADGPQCEASTLTEYFQRDTTAVVKGTVSIASCPAGSTGSFTLVARVKDEAGDVKPLEFSETWQRDDAQDYVFDSTYPIGADVELVSVRVRGLKCTCAEPPAPSPQVREPPESL